ncbi:MAG TPA: alpha/beta fold hydrolase [Flavipsychrobacter sp.]|nr:alpha/beta fold hydrolase [Flavipsychrobacter sp.]
MKKVLLLHGAIGAQDHLQPLADKLSDSYDVLRYNFSGHGGTPFSDTDFSIASFAKEVDDFLAGEGIATVNIVGYSMGGYVGMYLARHYPGRVEKLVTLATKFHWDEATAAKETNMLNAAKIEEKLPAFAATLQKRHHPNDWKELFAKTSHMLLEMGKDNPLKLEEYAAIENPCLITIGDSDKMISLSETLDVFKALPHAQMAMLPNTQHPIEQANIITLTFLIKQFI